MWDPPRSGIEPVSPSLAGGFFTTESQRKPSSVSWPSWLLSKSCLCISQILRKNSSASDTDSIIWDLFWGLWSALDGGSALGASRWAQSLLHTSPKGPKFLGSWNPKENIHFSWCHFLELFSNWLWTISFSITVEPRCMVKAAFTTGCRMGFLYWVNISTWLSPPNHLD